LTPIVHGAIANRDTLAFSFQKVFPSTADTQNNNYNKQASKQASKQSALLQQNQ
jgi:hypothetical protein